MKNRVALVGAGLIGMGWAVVFAKAKWEVSLYDIVPGKAKKAAIAAAAVLRKLEKAGLLKNAAACVKRLHPVATLEEALVGATYVQENVLETPAEKLDVFQRLDELVPPNVICGSSTSTIPASQFSGSLKTRDRCIVVHPMTPPYLVPLVEVVPAPWSSKKATDYAMKLMRELKMSLILLKKEIFGFVLNRFQVGIINEAMYLVDQGVASPGDIEKTLTHGLGLRWSFMGMFQTMDLLAPTGFGEYSGKFGHSYAKLGAALKYNEKWTEAARAEVTKYLRGRIPAAKLPGRAAWRDKKLIRLHRANPLED